MALSPKMNSSAFTPTLFLAGRDIFGVPSPLGYLDANMLRPVSNMRAEPIQAHQETSIEDNRSSAWDSMQTCSYPDPPVAGNDQSPAGSSSSPRRPHDSSLSPRPTKVRKTSPDWWWPAEQLAPAEVKPVLSAEKRLAMGQRWMNAVEAHAKMRAREQRARGTTRVCPKCRIRVDSDVGLWTHQPEKWVDFPDPAVDDDCPAEMLNGKGTSRAPRPRNVGDVLAPKEPDLEACRRYVRSIPGQHRAFNASLARHNDTADAVSLPPFFDDHIRYGLNDDTRLGRIARRAGAAAQSRAIDRRVVHGTWERRYAKYKKPRPLYRVWQSWKITRSALPELERWRPRLPSRLGAEEGQAKGEKLVEMTAEEEKSVVYWGACPRCYKVRPGTMLRFY